MLPAESHSSYIYPEDQAIVSVYATLPVCIGRKLWTNLGEIYSDDLRITLQRK